MKAWETYSAYVPVFNNRATALTSVRSLQNQALRPAEVFVVDDGSTDGTPEVLENEGIEVVRMGRNMGRGAVRERAMLHAREDLVLCCDATNRLDSDFAGLALPYFYSDSKVAAVFGCIAQEDPRGAVETWRARYLYRQYSKQEATSQAAPKRQAVLATGGALIHRGRASDVGGFNPMLRHNEDMDLGQRLLQAGWDVVQDYRLVSWSLASHGLWKTLERYWRWNAGPLGEFRMGSYLRAIWFSVKCMAWQDLKRGELGVAWISLLMPHDQAWRTVKEQKRASRQRIP